MCTYLYEMKTKIWPSIYFDKNICVCVCLYTDSVIMFLCISVFCIRIISNIEIRLLLFNRKFWKIRSIRQYIWEQQFYKAIDRDIICIYLSYQTLFSFRFLNYCMVIQTNRYCVLYNAMYEYIQTCVFRIQMENM